MTTLYLMCGPCGSGKSTYAQELAEKENCVIISRDKIRFEMVSEEEKYFSKEEKVFRKFVREVKENLERGNNVVADATHLSPQARRRVLGKLDLSNIKLVGVNFLTSLEECIKRNNLRGGRAKVGEDVIREMYGRFIPAYINESEIYEYSEVYNVFEE